MYKRQVHVFVRPPSQVIQVFVHEVIFEFNGAAPAEFHVFVHMALFAPGRAVAEQPQQFDRVNAVLHPPAQENMPALMDDSGDVRGKGGQFFLQLFQGFRHEPFVRVQPQHPFCGDGAVVQSPVELEGVQAGPFMLDDLHPGVFPADRCV